MEFSEYQKRFFKELVYTNNNIVISAVAGSGKTTTIVEGMKLLPKDKKIIFLAFNNSIVNELISRVPNYAYVSTLHSFGFKSCIKTFGRIVVNEVKIFKIAEILGKSQKWFSSKKEEDKKLGDYCYSLKIMADILRLSLADDLETYKLVLDKHNFVYSLEDLMRLKSIIELSNKQIGSFDFTDMVYQPAIRNIRIPKFDYVFVDELQDLNKAQQELVKKMVNPVAGRFIGVGDPAQAIYSFAGADDESYERMKTVFSNTVELPLSVCYRCNKEIIKHAQEINPVIQPFSLKEEGEVRSGTIEEVKEGDWVLCRNVKPLVILFMQLTKEGKKAHIKGKDIGENLIKLINKVSNKNNLVIERLKVAIDGELLQLRVKLMRKKIRKPDNHPAMILLREKVEVIEILSENCNTSGELIRKIQDIFTESKKEIMLSTIHKSKGLENKRVFVICKELLPSKFAINEIQLKQEKNLMYVMRTRAKESLIYVTDFQL